VSDIVTTRASLDEWVRSSRPCIARRLLCVVTNDERVVLGLLGRRALGAAGDVRVEEAMTPGPSTVRPSARLDAIANRMRDDNLTRLLVTRSDGVLVGVLRREDLESSRTG